MKAYFDTTERHLAWDNAFPGIIDCFVFSGEYSQALSHVVLHESDLHTDAIDNNYASALVGLLHDGRDFGSGNPQAAMRAVAFLSHLRIIKDFENAPWLIIYSGGPLEEDKRSEIAEKVSVLLYGYPISRIRAIGDKIERDIANCEGALQNQIDRFVAALAQLAFADPNVALVKKRTQREGSLALLLLCEAWTINKGSATVIHNRISISAPITPEHWFHPFGKSVSKEGAKEIAADAVSLDVSAEVEAFLVELATTQCVLGEPVAKLAMALSSSTQRI